MPTYLCVYHGVRTGYSLPWTGYSLPWTGYSLPLPGYSLPLPGYSSAQRSDNLNHVIIVCIML